MSILAPFETLFSGSQVASSLFDELLTAKEEPLDWSEDQTLELDTTPDLSFLWKEPTISLVASPLGCSENAHKALINRTILIFGKVMVDYPVPKVVEVISFLAQLAKRAQGTFTLLSFPSI